MEYQELLVKVRTGKMVAMAAHVSKPLYFYDVMKLTKINIGVKYPQVIMITV